MDRLFERVNERLDKSWRFVFGKKKDIGNFREILTALYPTINFDRIRFYEGIPWFAGFVAPYVTAQALPHTYSFSKLNIYIKNFDLNKCGTQADVVHEAFHIQQYLHFNKGFGFGFFRSMLAYYYAYFLTLGYMKNPFEIPAYAQEFKYQRFCDVNKGLSEAEFLEKIKSSDMVTQGIEFKYTGKKIILVPAFIFAVGVAILKPLLEVLFVIAYGLSKTLSFVLYPLKFIPVQNKVGDLESRI
jgi:hypothetical protein